MESKFEYYMQRAKRFGYKTFFGRTEKGVECLLVLRERFTAIDAYIMDGGLCLPVGVLYYEDTDKPAFMYVSEINVQQDYRNKGIGRLMMEKFKDYAIHNGCSQIRLISLKDARGFYKKLGYQVDEINRAGFSNCVMDIEPETYTI